jgi:hypothetical protein
MSSYGHDLNKKIVELDHIHAFIVHNLLFTRSHLCAKIINIMYTYEGVSIVDLFFFCKNMVSHENFMKYKFMYPVDSTTFL